MIPEREKVVEEGKTAACYSGDLGEREEQGAEINQLPSNQAAKHKVTEKQCQENGSPELCVLTPPRGRVYTGAPSTAICKFSPHPAANLSGRFWALSAGIL